MGEKKSLSMKPSEKGVIARRAPRRKSYAAPRLTAYGTIQDLTKGGRGKAKDFPLAGTKSV